MTQTWPEPDDKIQCNVDNSDNVTALPSNLQPDTETAQTVTVNVTNRYSK